MPDRLDRQVKTALNETRLLILGVQVLLGFQLQGMFQEAFDRLPAFSQHLSLAALGLLFASAALLIAPSMQHRLVEQGYSSGRLLLAASYFAGLSLGFLAPALGLAVYVVFALHFGVIVAAVAGGLLALLAVAFWFGLEIMIGISTADGKQRKVNTPLSTRIEQVLMEARIIIPGAQALLGFQLTVMLTNAFDELAASGKIVHAVALGCVAINICLLMTPAALHRMSFAGEDSEQFLRMGSAIVIAAPAFLAAGIAGDIYVVFLKALHSGPPAIGAAIAAFVMAVGLWYALPLALRSRRMPVQDG